MELAGRWSGVGKLIPNVTGEVLANCREKRLHFMPPALRNQLDPAIRQVPHETRHIKPPGYRAGRIPKANALHLPGVVHRRALKLVSGHSSTSNGADLPAPRHSERSEESPATV